MAPSRGSTERLRNVSWPGPNLRGLDRGWNISRLSSWGCGQRSGTTRPALLQTSCTGSHSVFLPPSWTLLWLLRPRTPPFLSLVCAKPCSRRPRSRLCTMDPRLFESLLLSGAAATFFYVLTPFGDLFPRPTKVPFWSLIGAQKPLFWTVWASGQRSRWIVSSRRPCCLRVLRPLQLGPPLLLTLPLSWSRLQLRLRPRLRLRLRLRLQLLPRIGWILKNGPCQHVPGEFLVLSNV